MAEKELGDSPELRELLRLLVEEKADDAKAKKVQREKDAADLKERIQSQIDSAKFQNELNEQKRIGCAHAIDNPATGTRKTMWRGQVNSDGFIVPVCGLCFTILPKVKANEYQIKEGAQFEKYTPNQLTVDRFEAWHKGSFPDGCDRADCYLCHPVAKEAVLA